MANRLTVLPPKASFRLPSPTPSVDEVPLKITRRSQHLIQSSDSSRPRQNNLNLLDPYTQDQDWGIRAES